ncbi:hypothetical protein ACFQ0M_48270 [Kitasatospora aburaviensis]|uniref:Uncharacterized protein n=1 Tax=Kitasatospora aburaviensis TaxID=67265 RepID=A0ABW1EY91_9ACTN
MTVNLTKPDALIHQETQPYSFVELAQAGAAVLGSEWQAGGTSGSGTLTHVSGIVVSFHEGWDDYGRGTGQVPVVCKAGPVEIDPDDRLIRYYEPLDEIEVDGDVEFPVAWVPLAVLARHIAQHARELLALAERSRATNRAS